MTNLVTTTFKLKTLPFKKDIVIDDLFNTEAYEEVFMRLRYACENKEFAILLSQPGCGKSTMLRRLSQSLDTSKYQYIYISDSKLTPRWLYNYMLEQLGLGGYLFRGDGKRVLHQQVKALGSIHNKSIVCCIDESHLLSKEAIEELRFLLNYEMDSKSPLTLILSGQNELRQKLRTEKFAAVRQRIGLVCEIPALDELQVRMYIEHHLKVAGYEGEFPFDDEAMVRILNFSGGIMRLINKVCLQSMILAATSKQPTVTGAIVKNVVEREML